VTADKSLKRQLRTISRADHFLSNPDDASAVKEMKMEHGGGAAASICGTTAFI